MSINLGHEGLQAARALRMDPQFAVLRAAIGEFAWKKIEAALDAPPELRVEATAYARALRDLYVAIEAGATDQMQRNIKLPRGEARAGETKAGVSGKLRSPPEAEVAAGEILA